MTTAAAARLNLKTRHGRELARAATANPLYVIPPPPPPMRSPTMTVYQQGKIDYDEKVHQLRIGYQKEQHLLRLND